jgi:hypothetical protein
MNTTQFLMTAAAMCGALQAQRWVQLPDNHHLTDSQTQAHSTGTTTYWGGATLTGRRFQVLYDASHFTGIGGVSTPMTIGRVHFRCEDSEHNVGGQTYAGVTANIYSTTLTSGAALNTTFANNLPPAVLTSTLLASLPIATLTVGASLGRSPNNNVITLDFSGLPALPFDPTGAQPNLLIDITYTGAAVAPDPQGSTMASIQDASGGTPYVRGRGLANTASAVALTGTAQTVLPTMQIEFAGNTGGFPALTPARNERFGAACGGSPSSFYQLFPSHTYFDLKDPGQVDGLSGLRLTPNTYPGPTTYCVTGGANPIDLVNGLLATPTSTGDDTTVPNTLPAGAAFDYPGAPAGGTTVIRAATNGYVIVDPASTETAADFSPTVAEFLGSTATNLARFAPFWHDFSPNKNALPVPFGDPQAGMHVVNNVATTEVLITWYRAGRFNSVVQAFQESHTMQCSLNWTTGVVEFRYGSMDEIWADTFSGTTSGIVGFSRGRIAGVSSVDPQSRDLSIERPFSTRVEGTTGNMGLTSRGSIAPVGGPVYMGRGYVGQTLFWDVTNVPVGTIASVTLLDVAASRPGIQGLPLFLPSTSTCGGGCQFSLTFGAIVWETFILPTPTIAGTVGFPVPAGYQPGLMGFDLYAQHVTLDFVPPAILSASSNAIRHTIGNN